MKKPWHRKGRGWFITFNDGRQAFLNEDKTQAFEAWHDLAQSEVRKSEKNPTFVELAADFCQYAERQIRNGDLSAGTLADYVWYLDQFIEIYGDWQIELIEPQHVTDWLNQKDTWGPAGQRGAITAIKRVLSWAKKERRISQNNLEGLEKPSQRRREELVDDGDHIQMLDQIRKPVSSSPSDKQFQLVLVALRHCGGRPQDIATVMIEHVSDDLSQWTLPDHKRYRHTHKPKLVYLSPCLRTITMMVKGDRTEGPLFRGRRGQLTVNAIGCRIKSLKKKLDIDPKIVAYSYRHTYITEAMGRGVDIAMVAELTGTSVEMIRRHYGHLDQMTGHLKDAASRAVGGRVAVNQEPPN